MNYVLSSAAVDKLKGALRGPSNSGGTSHSAGVVSYNAYLPPFTVRWASNIEPGGGGWIIWLPSATLLCVNGVNHDVRSLYAVGAPYPEGWYRVPFSPEVYCNIHIDEGYVSCSWSNTPGQPQSPTDVCYPIHVASLISSATAGTKMVKQYVSSTIVIGGESGTAPTAAPSPFDISNGVIINRTFYFDGSLQTLSGSFTPPTTGTVYLTGTATRQSVSGEYIWTFVNATTPATAPSGGKVLNIKLYDFSDGAVTMDYRTTFLSLNDSGGYTGKVDVVVDVQWDMTNHKLVKKTQQLDVSNGLVVGFGAATTTDVTNGDAVPVSGLITASNSASPSS